MIIHLNQGHFAAFALLFGLIIWVTSGQLDDPQKFHNPRPLVMDSGLKRVQVERMEGQKTQRDVIVSGRTAPNRRVELRAEIRAKVIKVHKKKGSRVSRGDIIIELDGRDWPARLKQAKANRKQRLLEATSARQLYEKGLANEAQTALAQTALANAEADVIQAQIQVNATKIRAPFDGIIDQRFVEVGDFLQDGQSVVTLLDFSPYLITGQVPELEAANIHIGDPGFAELINGDRVDGHVRFISAEANLNTRTFAIELEIDNPSGVMTSGLTAKIHIPQPMTHAYYISPALLIINSDGRLGLKGIDEQHRVIFHPIKLLKADNQGIWIYGLGKTANIITVGQGFVEYGEQVEPVYLEQQNTAADNRQDSAAEKTLESSSLSAG